ncbi:MAG: hypothetical protein JW828_06930 [Sedimentisphaerales bacterium]|nr:hypothetical protein [Sedimentisphaerales bacterium]
MSTKVKLSLVLVTGLISLYGTIQASDETKLEFGVGVDYFSKYIWRGQNLQDDGAIQPALSFTYGSLTGSIWGSLDLTNYADVDGDGSRDNSGEITEVDYSLDYTDSIPGLEGLSYSIGVINYTFPNTPFDDTTEVYAGLGFDLPLSPTVTLYRDVDNIDGTYINFGVSHSYDKIAELASDMPVGMEISASLGWGSNAYNKGYWGISDDSAQDLTISLAFPFELSGWSVTPSISYISLMSSDLRAADTFDKDSDYLVFGIGISKTF